jgi:hypothetical protein
MILCAAVPLEVQPPAGQSPVECWLALRDEVARWVGERFGQAPLSLSFDGSRVAPAAGHEVWTHQREAGGHGLATLDWEFPHATEPSNLWHFACTLACDAAAVQMAVILEVHPRSFSVQPFHAALEPGNPFLANNSLLSRLVTGWKCSLEGQPVPSQARMLGASEVDAFVEQTLLNSARVLPVVVLSPPGPPQGDAMDPERMQNCLLCLAEVVALADGEAADRLTACLGPERSCAGGLIRTYWPGFRRDSPPEAHPLADEAAVGKMASDGGVEGTFYACFSTASGSRFREGPVVRAARVAVALETGRQRHWAAERGRLWSEMEAELVQARTVLERRGLEVEVREARAARDRLQQEAKVAQRQAQTAQDRARDAEAELREVRAAREHLRKERDALQQQLAAVQGELHAAREQLEALRAAPPAELAPSGESVEELMAEVERMWDDNARLRAEGETARKRIEELQAELHDSQENWALVTGMSAAPAAPPAASPASRERTFASVADALRAAAVEFADVLTVWEDALQAAERSLYKVPEKVFRALQAIAEVGREFFRAQRGREPLGPVDRAFSQRIPFKYAAFESQTTMSLYGSHRIFRHLEQSRQMQRHLTLGGGETSNCLQIYFDFDESSHRVLIGYCGRHLPYYGQRT